MKNALSGAVLSLFSQAGASFAAHENYFYLFLFQQAPSDEKLLHVIQKHLATQNALKKGGEFLRINFQIGDPPTLNPRLAHDINCHILSNFLFEGLTALDNKGKIVPAAAAKITLSACQLHYTFHLRDSKWSNGKPVTAHDFVRSWQKSLTAASKARIYLNFFLPIKNVERIVEQGAPVSSAGFFAVNEKTLHVELASICPHFLNLLSSPPFFLFMGNLKSHTILTAPL